MHSTRYLVLLAQYVSSIGQGGGGASSGRYALVFFLVLLAGKNKETIEMIPLLAGFFAYQLAVIVCGLKPPPVTKPPIEQEVEVREGL